MHRLNTIKTMNIESENAALEELYTTGGTQDYQYRSLSASSAELARSEKQPSHEIVMSLN